MQNTVLCVGEILWDAMPAGLFLGGAPYNVAAHLQRLGQPAALVSRVGDDRLGHEALRRMEASGVGTPFVQTDPHLPTGFVQVGVDSDGIPDYEILQPAAWDAIALSEALLDAATGARAVVYGSLSQRHEASRRTVEALISAATLAIFDVNLRPPFASPAVVQISLQAADVVKLNEEELGVLSGWFGWPASTRRAIEALAAASGSRLVCVTRGKDGAVLWRDGRLMEHPGYPVAVRDTVGSGDAFLAGLLAGLLAGQEDAEALDHACRLGAFVATQSGATPGYGPEDLTAFTMLAS